MVAITATNASTPLKPVVSSRSRLEQARRQADQAEANARQLRALADQAEQELDQTQSKVSSLSAQVAQESRASQAAQVSPADSTYTAQVKSGASLQNKQVQDFLARVATVALNQFSSPENPLKSGASSAPVLNVQGQSTGRIVNLSA
jgi:F0F1-type ATP synthase membrane subunit b/b'